MPAWVMRLVWRVRGRRLVRLHLVEERGVPFDAIDGVLVGRWGGHYVVLLPKIVRPGGETALEGHVEVPAARVVMVQVLGRAR
mgnify:CR=1 FL=1